MSDERQYIIYIHARGGLLLRHLRGIVRESHRAAGVMIIFFPSAQADAVESIRALLGRYMVHARSNRDFTTSGKLRSGTDSGSPTTASSRDGSARDGDFTATGKSNSISICFSVSTTDTGTTLTASSIDGSACDADTTGTKAYKSTADSCRKRTAFSSNFSARDGNITHITMFAATDTGSTVTAVSRDNAALDFDGATVIFK